jgi:energy-coupling factor transporter ATP-binding protein EcfA2
VWFFSFLVNFAQIRKSAPDRPLVLLLDEPGTALHGLAQRDFLKVLDERLTEHQVIYTTHQPFLVDPDRLDRARPVVDDGHVGTEISNNAYKIDRDTLFPLQAALGYEIGQTLFVAPNVLLVEGTSDLIYLKLLSRAVERSGGRGLDARWTITPVGGIDKMDTFVRLFKPNQLNICAVVDAANRLTRMDRLVRDGDLEQSQVIRITDVITAKEGDTEDLFSDTFYLSLLHGLAKEDPARAIYAAVQKGTLLDKKDERRITRRIDHALANFNQTDRLDHLAPALYFDRHQDTLLEKVDGPTIERAGKLFDLVNAQLLK